MKNKELLRSLTLRDAIGIGLGAIIGAGIFVVIGVAAGVAGPAFIIGLIAAGMVASFNALSSAQLAASHPYSGGTYEYGYILLNPSFGFSAGWMFLISKLSAAGVVAIGFGAYFYQLIPIFSPKTYSLSAVLLLTAANYFGVKKAGILNLVIVTITLLSLFYFVFSGVSEVKMENFEPFAPFGFTGIIEATAILFFAFTGYARIATLAEEVNEPQKTIPKAIIITILTAIVLYAAIVFIATGIVGVEKLSNNHSPLQVAADALNSPSVSVMITIGASMAMLGVLLSQILGVSRVMLAMGRRGDLPPVFKLVHKKFHVPHIGILITGAIILILVLVGSLEFIVRSATFTILLYYGITNAAAIRQPKNEKLYPKIIPWLGLMGCVLMSFSLPLLVMTTGVGLLLVGFVLRMIIHQMIK